MGCNDPWRMPRLFFWEEKKLGPRAVKWTAQGHIAPYRWDQILNLRAPPDSQSSSLRSTLDCISDVQLFWISMHSCKWAVGLFRKLQGKFTLPELTAGMCVVVTITAAHPGFMVACLSLLLVVGKLFGMEWANKGVHWKSVPRFLFISHFWSEYCMTSLSWELGWQTHQLTTVSL